MSNSNEIVELYKKERQYEQSIFGDYAALKSLNVASFILLLENYIEKMKKAYCGKWDKELPPWLLDCKEFDVNQSAPVNAYENLIIIMTLAGAALEAYTKIDPTEWRANPEIDKKKWEE